MSDADECASRRVAQVRAKAAEPAAFVLELPPCHLVLLVEWWASGQRLVAARQFLPRRTVFGLQQGATTTMTTILT